MAEKIIDDYQIISIHQLIIAIKEGRDNSERFCFIIGSGASVSSGIPTGITLEAQWMKEMEESSGMEVVKENARNLKDHLENDFADIEKDWEETKKTGAPLPSRYYFDIYKLRFFPNHRNGYHYLEKVMAGKNPGFGYHPLALMLTDKSGSNLVITTNFDSLLEDALFLYTDSKPLVINHELLAEYAGDSNIKRPIIAKVHRGIFFDPLNQPEETNELKGKWHDVLASVFQNYTPIVIGYGGGDNSLMNLLEDDNIRMKNGIYWCYFEKHGIPNDKIQNLIKNKKGYFVRTAGFDATMLAVGNALFPDKIGVHEAEEYLNNRISTQITNYEEEYKKLTELENTAKKECAENESDNDFKQEIEKMQKRTIDSEKEREKQNQMTAWDYRRQGQRYRNLNQFEKAIRSYSNAICMQQNNATFYNDRGRAYLNWGNFDKSNSHYDNAIADFNMAIKLNPEYAYAYNSRGFAYGELEEYNMAIADFDKAIELRPEWANLYSNRGYVYIKLEEYDKAAADFDKAIELDPEYANSYKHYGVLCRKTNDLEKAITLLTKAIERNPDYKEAYKERMEVYRLMGETEKAQADEAVLAKL
ncbi:MAG: tetratricopeptide repeat protein [Dorea sp.]|nr:tetratricopeptide repeat protein [Dorea sp.]